MQNILSHHDVRFFTIRRGTFFLQFIPIQWWFIPSDAFQLFLERTLRLLDALIDQSEAWITYREEIDLQRDRKKDQKNRNFHEKDKNFKSIKISMSSAQDKSRWLIIHDALIWLNLTSRNNKIQLKDKKSCLWSLRKTSFGRDEVGMELLHIGWTKIKVSGPWIHSIRPFGTVFERTEDFRTVDFVSSYKDLLVYSFYIKFYLI